SPNLSIDPLATEHLYLIGPKVGTDAEADIAMGDVVKLPLILPHSNQWTKPALETAAARLGLPLQIDLEIDSTASAIEIVAAGGGYSIMPGSLRKSNTLPPLAWRQIVSPSLEPVISMIVPTRLPRSVLSKSASQIAKATLLDMY